MCVCQRWSLVWSKWLQCRVPGRCWSSAPERAFGVLLTGWSRAQISRVTVFFRTDKTVQTRGEMPSRNWKEVQHLKTKQKFTGRVRCWGVEVQDAVQCHGCCFIYWPDSPTGILRCPSGESTPVSQWMSRPQVSGRQAWTLRRSQHTSSSLLDPKTDCPGPGTIMFFWSLVGVAWGSVYSSSECLHRQRGRQFF